MDWEMQYDCIKIMKDWLVSSKILNEESVNLLEKESRSYVKQEKQEAWNKVLQPVLKLKEELFNILDPQKHESELKQIADLKEPNLNELVEIARSIFLEPDYDFDKTGLKNWLNDRYDDSDATYHSHLYSETAYAAVKVKEVPAVYSKDSKELNGYQILNTFFDSSFSRDHRLMAFGEDLGKIGDVNQGFAGLQEKFGENRIFDTGIREWTILGQAIGCALRGLRPISEIQYLDYIVYALSPLMDDLATLRYRSAGQQACPAIIRTRGHRLEGIWHTGSPMGMLLHSLRGIYICVPRNMTQAAGMYNTLLHSDDPGLVIECLNAYRLKETLPDNIHEFTVPLGKIEILEPGNDITLVTYGSCVRVAQKATEKLKKLNIGIELIDVQTLLPFDLSHEISKSIEKTNKLIILDEDVPGAASAFILQQILENQNAFRFLDAPPITITARDHRSPYGSTGDYFTKPNAEDIVEKAISMMYEYFPSEYSN
jgi:pyruvate/2-oxoglutarate/acetoin dehydrogenase E1 component